MADQPSGDSKQSETVAKEGPDTLSSPAHVTLDFFEAHITSSFFADPASAIVSPSLADEYEQIDKNLAVELRLIEVTRYGESHTPKGFREPFSILFCAPHQQPLISAIYTVSHPDLPDMSLFLNPVQVSLECRPEDHPDGLFYETTFS